MSKVLRYSILLAVAGHQARAAKAGVPRYAELVCFSGDPGEAALNYFILKLMGFPDIKVLVSQELSIYPDCGTPLSRDREGGVRMKRHNPFLRRTYRRLEYRLLQ